MDVKSEGPGIAIVGNFNPPDSGRNFQAEVLLECFRLEHLHAIPVTYQQNRYLRPFWTLAELVRNRRDYDLICCQAFSFGNWVNTLVTFAVSRTLGKRLIIVYRGGGFREFVARYSWLVIPFLRRADQLVVPSGFLQDQFRRHGLSPKVIPNIVELEDWPYRHRASVAPKLLWVRHLRPGYNPWMAFEVLEKVRERYPEATLDLVGGGELEEEIRGRLRTQPMTGVTIHGVLAQDRLKRVFDLCDIFINTTFFDNQPRSVLEAMACGLPVISTDVGGLPYLIQDGRQGLLVKPADSQAMADAVIRLVEDDHLAQALASSARGMVKGLSWKSSRNEWLKTISATTAS